METLRVIGRAAVRGVGAFLITAFFIGFFSAIVEANDATIQRVVDLVSPIAAGGVFLWALVRGLKQLRDTREAKQASSLVDEELATAGHGLAGISRDELVQRVRTRAGSGVSDGQLERLVEQRRQERLADDKWLQEDVSRLIAKYVQPLPRNAKRMMNRFRVELLIADSRGLLKGGQPLTPSHIAKWLVLAERWPLLRLSLSADPQKMAELERESRDTAPRPTGPPDFFMQSLKALAPYYEGDEDLRTFIHSDPQLGDVLQRLVHYGAVPGQHRQPNGVA